MSRRIWAYRGTSTFLLLLWDQVLRRQENLSPWRQSRMGPCQTPADLLQRESFPPARGRTRYKWSSSGLQVTLAYPSYLTCPTDTQDRGRKPSLSPPKLDYYPSTTHVCILNFPAVAYPAPAHTQHSSECGGSGPSQCRAADSDFRRPKTSVRLRPRIRFFRQMSSPKSLPIFKFSIAISTERTSTLFF